MFLTIPFWLWLGAFALLDSIEDKLNKDKKMIA